MSRKKKLTQISINPDEIFVDSENIPNFDIYQFEGRLEKPIAKPTFAAIGICFLLLGILLFSKIIHLQIIKGEVFSQRSKNNYLRSIVIAPARGIIYDRNGRELAWNDFLNDENGPKIGRAYVNMPGSAHVLGYVGIGPGGRVIGIDGVEKKYENILGGIPGTKLIETDSKNEIKSESILEPPESGKSIRLTIDAKLQSQFYKILESVIQERGFGGGAGVILDVKTGEILALTSFPEYNSQVLSRGQPEDIIKKYFESPGKPFVNRAISGLYAPGSIIKPLIALASLNEKVISPDKQIFSSGSISLPNPFFPDKPNVFYDWKAHGWVDLRRAIAVSSNVYFYTVGGGYEDIKGLGINKIEKYADLFNFGQKTNIGSLIKKKGDWFRAQSSKLVIRQTPFGELAIPIMPVLVKAIFI